MEVAVVDPLSRYSNDQLPSKRFGTKGNRTFSIPSRFERKNFAVQKTKVGRELDCFPPPSEGIVLPSFEILRSWKDVNGKAKGGGFEEEEEEEGEKE